MARVSQFSIKLFADGADFDSIVNLAANPLIKGFTTNPTLARNAGVRNYEEFGRRLLAAVPDRPVSLEVFADDFAGMARQARTIATWGKNVNVKIPVTNTNREFSGEVIRELSAEGIAVNVTAITTIDQVRRVAVFIVPDEVDELRQRRPGSVTAENHNLILSLAAEENHGFERSCALDVGHHQVAVLSGGGREQCRYAGFIDLDRAWFGQRKISVIRTH